MTAIAIDDDPETALLERCRERQETWAALSVRQRLRPVRAFRALLVDEHAALCEAVRQDVDKPANETLACEILPLAAAARFLKAYAAELLQPRLVTPNQRPLWLWGQTDWVHRRPRGVIGVIGTWNYPLLLNGVQVLQALTAGNAVIWKPSELAVASAVALWRLFQRAGFPADLLNRLPATREAGPQLAALDLDHVVFTGQSSTGRALAANLGQRLISSTLELSGCDAMLVLADADVALAARAAWFGATLNRGQTCLAVRRVFVARQRYEAFLQALAPLAAKAEAVELVSPAQVQVADQLVQDALAEGAQFLVQPPTASSARQFGPAVLKDARPTMTICRAATFAPLLAVMPFDRLEEAVAAQVLCPYCLGLSIFTASVTQAQKLAEQIKTGVVCINDVLAPTSHPATPLPARGGSGWGATQGAEGLLEMTVPQVVSVRAGRWRPHYDPVGSNRWTDQRLLLPLLQWGHARRWRDRLKGFFQVCRRSLFG